MKKLYLTILSLFMLAAVPASAQSSISLKFSRTGTDAQSVTVNVTDENGDAIQGATATLASSHSFKATSNAVTGSIICPNANANTSPTIELTFTINGIPNGFTFDNAGLDIHALNGGSNYQENNDGVTRQWSVNTTVNSSTFGSLNDIDVAAGVGTSGNVHKVWDINGATTTCNGSVTIKLTITKGTTNAGCFFGLSEVLLTTAGTTPAPEPTPEPEPDNSDGKIYYISWKTTGTNYITEEADNRMTVQSNDVTKAQFWKLIPTDKENCFYIKNTATGRYIGSCNLTPSSDSKIHTSAEPVEYYVGKTTATSGETANCYWFSSTDCDSYSNENAGPRALNKDGASNYVITWQAGTSRVGSYWTLIETDDLYEVRPFEASEAIGQIGASYNIETANGKNLTIANGKVTLVAPNYFDENQEWYFVGTGNSTGWQIASASEPAVVIGITDGNITASEGATTRWKVKKGDINGYFYFTSGNSTLKIEGDSLFRFSRLRSAYSRNLKIYNNPCGATGNIYAKKIEIHGEGAVDNIVYENSNKPGTWHIMYAMDKGAVAKGDKFDIDVTLSGSTTNSLTATAHFDWNSDGVFETAVPLTLSGTGGNAEVTVPEWANETQTRMRLRINSNGLDLAEDEVYGFIYDFHIKVVEAQENRTAAVSVNSWERGEAVLSETAGSYAYGTTLTAKATAYGNAQFVCWREEGVVVSTEAEHTFTVDRNVKLVAYFTPNTDENSYPTGIAEATVDRDIRIEIQDGIIVAQGTDNVVAMQLYTIDAATVAKDNGNTLDITGIKEGVYIVRVTTANGYKNVKVYLNK